MQPRNNSPNPLQNGNPYFSDNANSSSTRASATRNLPQCISKKRPRLRHIREYRLGRGLVRPSMPRPHRRARFRGSLGGNRTRTDNPARRHQYLDQISPPVVCVPPVCKGQPLDPGVDGRLRTLRKDRGSLPSLGEPLAMVQRAVCFSATTRKCFATSSCFREVSRTMIARPLAIQHRKPK